MTIPFAVMVAGSIAGAGDVGVGGSFDVSVTVKNVKAYIASGAQVDAEGNGAPIVAFSGSFTESWTADPLNLFDPSAISSKRDDHLYNPARFCDRRYGDLQQWFRR
jgi:hypothetical protein